MSSRKHSASGGGGGNTGEVEASAVALIKRAVELDNSKRYTESLICYQEGIQMLLDTLKYVSDESKRSHYRNKVATYMDRAEMVKKLIDKDKSDGTYHEQMRISDGETGHSYEKLFGRFLDPAVTDVTVEDPYIRSVGQISNLLRLCELLVKRCPNLSHVTLFTSADTNNQQTHQHDSLRQLADSLSQLQQHAPVKLDVVYKETLHDREIRINNGWIFKIGRGLDIYKPTKTKFSIGFHDFDLRECKETTVDIFHVKHMKEK